MDRKVVEIGFCANEMGLKDNSRCRSLTRGASKIGEGTLFYYQKVWAVKHRTALAHVAPSPLAAACFPITGPSAAVY